MPRNLLRAWLGAIFCVCIAACSQKQLLEKVTWPEDRALAISALNDVERGDANALAIKLDPRITPRIRAVFPQMRSAFPPVHGRATLVDGRYLQRLTGSGHWRRASLVYQISGDGRYAIAQFTIIRVGRSARITGFYVNRLSAPVSSLNRFTLAGKSLAQYAILLLAIAALAVTIAALIRLWRTTLFKRRWLWTIGCLLGLTMMSVNWTTGDVWFQPLYFTLFSAGAARAGLGPWVISVGIPVVALYVILARRSGRKGSEEMRV